MSTYTEPIVKHLIVDSAAFFKRARLENFGKNIYTVPSVLDEIKDQQTRDFILSLPVTVIKQQPEKESVKWISDLAKKTGDLSILSKTDLNVLALTYELHRQHVGEPTIKEVKPLPTNLCQMSQIHTVRQPSESSDTDNSSESESDHSVESDANDSGLPRDEDWITEDNFDAKALQDFGLGPNTGLSDFSVDSQAETDENNSLPDRVVSCLTTDFAMQNVLLHAGLDIMSLQGLQIRSPRTHLLWCSSCFKPTKRTDTYFCPNCGHSSLRRIPVTLHDDGHLEFHFSRRYIRRLRGLKQPIIKPKGGKYADDPIYCADQRLPDRRPARPKNANVQPIATNGLLDTDGELADTLDFCCDLGSGLFPMHDISSRAAVRGIRSDHQIPLRSYGSNSRVEHGLKPTRATNAWAKPRTGNKKKKRK